MWAIVIFVVFMAAFSEKFGSCGSEGWHLRLRVVRGRRGVLVNVRVLGLAPQEPNFSLVLRHLGLQRLELCLHEREKGFKGDRLGGMARVGFWPSESEELLRLRLRGPLGELGSDRVGQAFGVVVRRHCRGRRLCRGLLGVAHPCCRVCGRRLCAGGMRAAPISRCAERCHPCKYQPRVRGTLSFWQGLISGARNLVFKTCRLVFHLDVLWKMENGKELWKVEKPARPRRIRENSPQ